MHAKTCASSGFSDPWIVLAPPDGHSLSVDSALATNNSSRWRCGMGSPAKLACHLSCNLSGIYANLMQEPGDWYAHSNEMQAGLRAWNTVLSDRCEVADHRF
jgi:hypothetical protein